MTTTKSHRAVLALVEAALMIALATILDFLPPFYRFPQGGSIDLSMVPILLYCLRWGPKWSLGCCFVNGVLQYFIGGGIAISWQSMLLDYVVAYTLVFVCGFAAGRKLGWLWGTILAGLGRWVSLTLSGALLWYEYMPETFLGVLHAAQRAAHRAGDGGELGRAGGVPGHPADPKPADEETILSDVRNGFLWANSTVCCWPATMTTPCSPRT